MDVGPGCPQRRLVRADALGAQPPTAEGLRLTDDTTLMPAARTPRPRPPAAPQRGRASRGLGASGEAGRLGKKGVRTLPTRQPGGSCVRLIVVVATVDGAYRAHAVRAKGQAHRLPRLCVARCTLLSCLTMRTSGGPEGGRCADPLSSPRAEPRAAPDPGQDPPAFGALG